MLSFLPATLTGCLSFLFYVINTIFWAVPIVIGSLLKALIPVKPWQKLMSYILDAMANSWVAINTLNQKLFIGTKIDVDGLSGLKLNDWYLVISNHQSWVDILVLQRVLLGKIPFLKFFLKKELIYVPIIGIAWWALDFPFMKRYSQSFLKKNPHLIGSDIATTRKACEKFKNKPVSVMNFIEGTRFTQAKHEKQKSPFQHLLRPKAGGIAYVLDAMGEHLTKVVNVTIYYPKGIPTFWQFVSGQVDDIEVNIETFEINEQMSGDYFNDKAFKQSFQQWLNQLWHDKDAQLALMTDQSNK
ncbi:acyltransferase [Thalassotalea eurytherma]|uniref:Acyltransferase n=1 Tax=Thalassotalea eurytherma TaxID=1144278 RepID=A0ABQ6GXM4_9GAMM|nr:acyltransferase [Thalassotalea eurytherma]GLX80698.1 acyltransferase [Thalassotalea eurytherma]